MRVEEAAAVAAYHHQLIPTAFLSQLGVRFLTHVYRALHRSRHAFIFVAVDANDGVIGFICGATSVKGLYRSVLLRRGWLYAGLLLRQVLHWNVLRRVIETLFYPSKLGDTLPQAELLSIAVDPGARGSGVATALLDALLGEFRRRGCGEFRVLVGADLDAANAYYIKHGFALTDTTESHGVASNVYVRGTAASGRGGG